MKNAMRRVLDFLRPAGLKERGEARPEVNDQVLARLNDSDSVYRALMDHAFSQAENHLQAAIQAELDPEKRAFACGELRALVQFIATVEGTRVRAKEFLQQQTKPKKGNE